MNGNSLGNLFRVTTWGESHGPALGAVIDGCPAGLSLNPEDFLLDMTRRQGGGSAASTPRKESDQVFIESGVYEGLTTGTPISLRIQNQNMRSEDYSAFRHTPRPGHADLTTYLKHEHRDPRGGGRSSARETTARVAAGVIAKKLLHRVNVEVLSWVSAVGDLALEQSPQGSLLEIQKLRDQNSLGLPLLESSTRAFQEKVNQLREQKDSLGGSIQGFVQGLEPGLGEPIFDKLNAVLSHSLMSLPAAIGCAIGGGRALRGLPGSEIRDPIVNTPAGLRPASNRHGGLLGGITTGLPLLFEVDFHAPTSIPQPIASWNIEKKSPETILVEGRHDAFPLPRALPMVEAMVAITLVDAHLRRGNSFGLRT